jgi:phosphoribosylaminoimidazolecarboxamide formyltransferase / IMP cyclohydrolase
MKKIKHALISVYHKDKIEEIVKSLIDNDVEIISTGGTYDYIKNLGYPVIAVENITGYPSIFGGRVKTLHPKIFGGILYRRNDTGDRVEKEHYEVPDIDLVIVDLYPFEEYAQAKASESEIIEKIDIGGISLIRAAAKNFADVVILSSKDDYDTFLKVYNHNGGCTTLEDRKYFATKAFLTSSHYDTMIFDYFNQESHIPSFSKSITDSTHLRYGENPHQNGVFFGKHNSLPKQIHGKEISYNNLLDIEAAIELISDFEETTLAIIKHNNACGCASRSKLIDAWKDALSSDPLSAFGGIIVSNREIDIDTAGEINKLFFEVIIAPSYNDEALNLLKSKKNRIILINQNITLPTIKYRSLLGGALVQEKDSIREKESDLKSVTQKTPTPQEIKDLLFANILVKHSKSNSIVIAKNSMLIASGVGQTSRVDALKQAIEKGINFGFSLAGAVMASDAFFPFPDCVEIAHNSGIDAVIQPGGSIKDQESIDYCDQHNIAMVMTGNRHFKH